MSQQTKRVCLITGGSHTLGADIAKVLASNGIEIAINYNKSEHSAIDLCNKIKDSGIRAEIIRADVSEPKDAHKLVLKTLDLFGQIDILVNNAGPYVDDPYLELKLEDFDHIMNTNVRATYLISQIAGKAMKQRGSGNVINIAATSAFDNRHTVYGLAKKGVIHLTKQLATELAPEIRVNAIAPGLIADNEDMSPKKRNEVLEKTPLGRLATRKEIAEVLYSICGPSFDSVTGQTIIIDGGFNLGQ